MIATTDADGDFLPCEAFPVGEYLRDELEARGWTTRDCAERMGGDVDVDHLTLDLTIAVVDAEPGSTLCECTMSEETANGLERALGSSAATWMALDRVYHKCRVRDAKPCPSTR